MKNLLTILLLFSIITPLLGQSALQGAWQLAGDAADTETVIIYSDTYFMFAQYHPNGDFLHAGGGAYQLEEENYEQTLDFYSADSSLVRQPQSFTCQLKGDQLILTDKTGDRNTWKRIEETPTPLTGAWRFGARVDEDGKVGERRQPGPRQTLKILSGTRCQWAAFNYETKQFSGTGGGTYSATDGKYTENIQFFSRDNNRVGQSLTFQFKREGNDWFHQGQSSTGKPLHEVWEKIQ
jgi:hypothetical protein